MKTVLKNVGLSKYENVIELDVTNEFNDNGINFSGGERQKIGIARLLLSNGDINVIDEFSNSLDRESHFKILNIIKENCKDKGLVIITHNKTDAEIVDKYFTIKDGRLIDGQI